MIKLREKPLLDIEKVAAFDAIQSQCQSVVERMNQESTEYGLPDRAADQKERTIQVGVVPRRHGGVPVWV